MRRSLLTSIALLLTGCVSLPDAVQRANSSVLVIPPTSVAANKERAKKYGFGESDYKGMYRGSAVAISKNRVLTCWHCVDSLAQIKVYGLDGVELEGVIAAADKVSDVAIVEFPGAAFKPAKLGNSDSLEPGDTVFAVGFPYGLRTTSAGIVAGLNVNIGPYRGLIQTDAALNNGSSGGGLFNSQGQLVGINTARIVGTDRIGVAIPVNKIKEFIRANR